MNRDAHDIVGTESRFTATSVLLIILITFAALMRFVAITKSPPGFYIDEAAISAQVVCVQQSGENLQGQQWPLFTEVLGGGYATPAYLYPAALWTSIFGNGVASFRAFTALFSVLFIFGSFVFGRRFWRSAEAGCLCALAAAVSPWAFQFSRIAWDPALAPAYLTWAFAFLWAHSRNRIFELALSGVLFALAAYVYPPIRVQVTLMLPLAIMGLVFIGRRPWRPYAVTVAIAFLMSVPLIAFTLNGEIQGRFQKLSIFNQDYLLQTFGSSSFDQGFRALFQNLRLLLSPSYLFLSGDANLRHSTGFFGIWSWLDDLGILTALAILGLVVSGRSKIKIPKFKVLFVIAGYLAGILPAALTGEGNPHALRSLGAVVFLALGVGGALSTLWRCSVWARSAVLGVAGVFFMTFAYLYFTEYPTIARAWFAADVDDLAKHLSSENKILEMEEALAAQHKSYASLAMNYYQLADGTMRCPVKKFPK